VPPLALPEEIEPFRIAYTLNGIEIWGKLKDSERLRNFWRRSKCSNSGYRTKENDDEAAN
jgi:hypothetical protein